MTAPVTEIPAPKASVVVAPPSTERKPLTKKEVAADHPPNNKDAQRRKEARSTS